MRAPQGKDTLFINTSQLIKRKEEKKKLTKIIEWSGLVATATAFSPWQEPRLQCPSAHACNYKRVCACACVCACVCAGVCVC